MSESDAKYVIFKIVDGKRVLWNRQRSMSAIGDAGKIHDSALLNKTMLESALKSKIKDLGGYVRIIGDNTEYFDLNHNPISGDVIATTANTNNKLILEQEMSTNIIDTSIDNAVATIIESDEENVGDGGTFDLFKIGTTPNGEKENAGVIEELKRLSKPLDKEQIPFILENKKVFFCIEWVAGAASGIPGVKFRAPDALKINLNKPYGFDSYISCALALGIKGYDSIGFFYQDVGYWLISDDSYSEIKKLLNHDMFLQIGLYPVSQFAEITEKQRIAEEKAKENHSTKESQNAVVVNSETDHTESYLAMVKKGERWPIYSNLFKQPQDLRKEIISFFSDSNKYHAENKIVDVNVIYKNGSNFYVISKKNGEKTLKRITVDNIMSELAKRIDYIKVERKEIVNAGEKTGEFREVCTHMDIPTRQIALIKNDLDLPKHFPEIDLKMRTHPYILPNGEIITADGYNPDTKIYLDNVLKIHSDDIINFQSHDEAMEAFKELIDPLSEFRYHSEIDHQNAIGVLFSVFMQPLHGSNSPFCMISKPAMQVGATLLLQCFFAYLGEPYSGGFQFPYADDGFKDIAGSIHQSSICPFDDMKKEVGNSHVMNAVLATGVYKMRKPWAEEAENIKIDAIFIGTGIELKTGSEFARRAVEIYLSKPNNPNMKRYGNNVLLDYIKKNQRRLEILMLSLIRYWIISGRPLASSKIPNKDSFETWREWIGGILEFYGYADRFLQEDPTRIGDGLDVQIQRERALLYALYEVFDGREVNATEIINRSKQDDDKGVYLADVLNPIIPPSTKAVPKKLGEILTTLSKRDDLGCGLYVKLNKRNEHSFYQTLPFPIPTLPIFEPDATTDDK